MGLGKIVLYESQKSFDLIQSHMISLYLGKVGYSE